MICRINARATCGGIGHDADMENPNSHAGNLRRGRYSKSGHYYFLTTCVAGRRRIFTNRKRTIVVLDAIRWLHAAGRFFVDAAVVMPEHLHLVGQLGESTLAKVMHTLKSYSAYRLALAGVETPVWQEGYHDHELRDDEDYRTRVRYVLQNPLRAGLVRRDEEYPYVILPDWWGDSIS
jgi:putative transposase